MFLKFNLFEYVTNQATLLWRYDSIVFENNHFHCVPSYFMTKDPLRKNKQRSTSVASYSSKLI